MNVLVCRLYIVIVKIVSLKLGTRVIFNLVFLKTNSTPFVLMCCIVAQKWKNSEKLDDLLKGFVGKDKKNLLGEYWKSTFWEQLVRTVYSFKNIMNETFVRK